jgi:hypothetical protein
MSCRSKWLVKPYRITKSLIIRKPQHEVVRIKDTFVPAILGFEREPSHFSFEWLWLCRRWTRLKSLDKNIKPRTSITAAMSTRFCCLTEQRRRAGKRRGALESQKNESTLSLRTSERPKLLLNLARSRESHDRK